MNRILPVHLTLAILAGALSAGPAEANDVGAATSAATSAGAGAATSAASSSVSSAVLASRHAVDRAVERQKMINVLRKNPKNKDFSDDQITSKVDRVIANRDIVKATEKMATFKHESDTKAAAKKKVKDFNEKYGHGLGGQSTEGGTGAWGPGTTPSPPPKATIDNSPNPDGVPDRGFVPTR